LSSGQPADTPRSHSGAADHSGLLGCYAVSTGKWSPTFRQIVATFFWTARPSKRRKYDPTKRRELYTTRHCVTFQKDLTFEANRSSASQEISHILWNLEVHYRVHNSGPLVSILSQINPIHNSPPHFFKA
jgi:hypothetical protein